MYVYVILSMDQLENIFLLPNDQDVVIEPEWNWSKPMTAYMTTVFGTSCPISAFYEKPVKWMTAQDSIICKVWIDDPKEQLVWYDDVLYVIMLNTLGNGIYEYLATSEEEEVRMRNASREECVSSFGRVFDIDVVRDAAWLGEMQPRAFIRCLKRDMIEMCFEY